MLVVNDSIKNAYSKYTTQRKSYIQVGNNSFFVQNLDVSADVYLDGNVIGNAIAKIVKFDVETVSVSGIDEFELFDGIWTGNQYEYISLGTFKLFNEEGTDDFFSSVTAYDKLVLFNKEYDPTQTTYPTTLYSLLQNICSQAGVELENASIPNGNQSIASNLFVENETLKNVLNAICQISGNYAIISKDKLKLLLKGTETIKLNKSQISNPEYKRTTWKINQVVLGMSDVEGEYVLRKDDADIEKNGVHKLVINDNPFVYTQALREAYIDNLFNQVKGFGYTAFDAQWEGLSYVELGDLLNIDGKESLVLRYNLKSPDGLKSTLSAPSIIDSVVEYIDNSNSIKNRQKRTEIAVDKQNQKIEAIVETQEEQSEKLTKLEQTDSQIKASVDSHTTSIKEISETIEVYSVDLDLYNLTIPVDTNNKPVETKSYEIGCYAYHKGKQVTPTITSKSAASGITQSIGSDKITLSVNTNTVITNINNELVFEFKYTVDSTTSSISKKIVVVLAQQGPQGIQGDKGDTGEQGPQGEQGIQGPKGDDGTSTYFYIRYSANANGSSMTTAPQSDTQYMGVASTTSPTAPTSASGYTWSKIKGEQGEQGIQGQVGENGKTSYLHIKYSEDGTTFTPADSEYNIGEKPSRWQGTYVDFTETDSTTFSDYKWVDTAIVVEDLITPTNVATGSNIYIEDASNNPLVDLEIEGKSTQETRSGKNLVNPTTDTKTINGITKEYLGDGIFHIYGTSTKALSVQLADITNSPITLLANSPYTISIKDMVNNGDNFTIATTVLKSDNTFVYNYLNVSTSSTILFTTKTGSEEYKIYNIDFYLGQSNVTIDATFKLQLEEGTVATEYEAYGVSPNPDYPSEIESVGYENSFDKDNTTIDKYLSIDGIENTSTVSSISDYRKVKENTNYIIGYGNIDSNYYKVVCFYDNAKALLSYFTVTDKENSTIIKTPVNCEYLRFHYHTANVDEIQLEEGIILHPYIPYGKSGVEVDVVGKNKLNNIASSQTINGVTFTVNKDKTITVNGTATAQIVLPISNNIVLSGTYRLSGCPSGGSSSTYELQLYGSGNAVDYGNNNAISTNPNCIARIVIRNGATLNNLMFKPQLEEGDTASEYEPHQKNTSLIVLDEPLRSLPNEVKDIAYIKNNKLYVDRKVGSVILDGSETFIYELLNNLDNFEYVCQNMKVDNAGAGLSNYYTNLIKDYIASDGKVRFGWYDNKIFFMHDTSRFNGSIEEFKTWLSTYNTEVIYELAEPYTEDLGEIEMPSTFKGVNHISTTDTLEPILNIEYVRDTTLSNYVENQINKVMTIEERHYSELVLEDDNIKASVAETSSSLDGTISNMNKLESTLTSQSATLEIISKNIDTKTGEVREVTTITGFTFNAEGSSIKDSEGYEIKQTPKGAYYKDGDKITGQYTKDGSKQKDLELFGTYSYGKENIDDTPMFIAQLYTDENGEECFGHFYNGGDY